MFTIDYESPETKAMIRLSLYFIALAVISAVAIVLVYVARGYDIDRGTGEVIQNGLILAESDPVSAQVFINGEYQNDSTPSKFALPQGRYTVRLEREGYQNWEKTVSLDGSAVRWMNYPLLVPDDLQTVRTTVPLLDSYESSYLSTDRKKLFLQTSNTEFLVYEPSDMSKRPIELSISRSLLDIDDPLESIGDISIHDTSANGKWVLIKHDHPERDRTEHIVMVLRDTDEFTNLTTSFKRDIVHLSHIDDDYKRFILRDSTGQTSVFNRENAELDELLVPGEANNLVNFEERIAYVQEGRVTSQLITQSGFGAEPVVAFNFPKSAEVQQLQVIEYERSTYVIALYDNTALVFENPFDQTNAPIAPFKSVLLPADASEVTYKKSTRNRFFSFISDTEAVTYDFDEDEIHSFTIESKEGTYEYIDNFRLAATDTKGAYRIIEFDGTNKYTVLEPPTDSDNFVSFDLKNLINIRLSDDEDQSPTVFIGELLP